MKKGVLRAVCAAGVLLGISVAVYSFGQKERLPQSDPPQSEQRAAETPPSAPQETVVTGQLVEISGTVRLVGSEPFPELVITDSQGKDWYIDAESRCVVAGFEQRTVTVRGNVELIDMLLANNKYVGTRRVLKNITLLAP